MLEFDCFGKAFKGVAVLRSASLWARPGAITVLMGRNGTGKSTLLRLGLGLLRSDRGATRWEGETCRRPRLAALARRGLFFLPDKGLLSRRLPLCEQMGFYAAAFGGRTEDAADALGLLEVLDLNVGQLSGGEERRAEMALVRLRRPRCLIADEPFMGLSPVDRARVASELRAHADRGAAVAVTGHEVEELMALADEVLWIVGGTTHVLGAPAAATRHDQFRREYLGARGGIEMDNGRTAGR